jgi:DNA-damage-inducible protein D
MSDKNKKSKISNQVLQDKIEDKTLDEFIKRLEVNTNHDQNGIEFWYARQLQEILEYGKWDNFKNVIEKAKIACDNFGQSVNSHFAEVGKMVEGGVVPVPIQDFQLSRYACYLIAQNADAMN